MDFAQELGTVAGLSAELTASFLGFSQLIGLLGTMAPWLLGRWVSRAVLGAAGLFLSACGVLVVPMVHTPTAYIAGNLVINLGYWVTLPLALSIAADLDRNSGRLVAFMLGMSAIGLALGPSLAGPLLGGEDTTLGAGSSASSGSSPFPSSCCLPWRPNEPSGPGVMNRPASWRWASRRRRSRDPAAGDLWDPAAGDLWDPAADDEPQAIT